MRLSRLSQIKALLPGLFGLYQLVLHQSLQNVVLLIVIVDAGADFATIELGIWVAAQSDLLTCQAVRLLLKLVPQLV